MEAGSSRNVVFVLNISENGTSPLRNLVILLL